MPDQDMSEGKSPEDTPFPWRCPKCGQLAVNRVTITYRCQRMHRGRTVTVEVPNLSVPSCSNRGEVVLDYATDEQIRAAVRTRLDADAKKTQTIIKCLCWGGAAFFFVMGLCFLFSGESLQSLVLLLFTLWFVLAQATLDMRMRVERIEDHFLKHRSL